MPRFYRFVLALSLLLVLAASASSHAFASGGARFGLQPLTSDKSNPATKSYFVFDTTPGTKVESQVRVVNSGTAPGTVQLYAVDATTGQTSGAVFLDNLVQRKDAGAWINLGVSQLTLQPGESAVVPFTVTIPTDARVGQHLGGIVAQDTELQPGETQQAGPKSAGFRVDVQNLTILAVQLNLPGPAVEKVSVTGITTAGSSGYQQLVLGLQNDGTQMVKPSGTLVVADSQGRELQRIALKLDTVLPQTAIQYPVLVQQQALGAGQYHAWVDLAYGVGGTTTHEQDFTITPAQVAQVFQAPAPLAPPQVTTQPTTAPTATVRSLGQLWSVIAGVVIAISVGFNLVLLVRRRSARRRS